MSAYKKVSILSGHRIERQEIGAPDDFAAIEAMSRVELEAYILAGVGELLIESSWLSKPSHWKNRSQTAISQEPYWPTNARQRAFGASYKQARREKYWRQSDASS